MQTCMASLDDYIRDLTSDDCIAFCAGRSGIPLESVRRRLVDYANEVRVGARMLDAVKLEGARLLEVGAGLGLLAVWLKRQGASVTLLEPGAGGFGDNQLLMTATLEWLGASDTAILPIEADALDRRQHGEFDVIYSVNVLEHIPSLERALDGMLDVLAAGGIMRHTCPNYVVPYEPHYGILLVPFWPSLTAWVFRRGAREELWQSLNFVTFGRIVRFCRARGLRYRFDGGTLAAAFERLERDEAFRARRGAVVRLGSWLLSASGVVALLRSIPPRWATPLVFTLWRADRGSAE
jgi:2-polyprenyl-3-methyl-5-hydroxy-6-metoxy-1,4-benzoquinol methylase